MAPSSISSITIYRTLCSKRAKAIDDAVNKSVKEHIGKVLGPKQIKHLEYIRAEFEDQNKCMWLAYEKFAIEEHEEIDQAKEIFDQPGQIYQEMYLAMLFVIQVYKLRFLSNHLEEFHFANFFVTS